MEESQSLFSSAATVRRFSLGLRIPAISLLTLTLSIFASRADDLADKGRAIFKKNQHVVVTVQLVLKSKISVGGMGNQANESRQEVTGTVLDPSGVTVVSLSTTDPGQMFQDIMVGVNGDESKFKMETELSDVKLLLDDGTEAPAEVVLRDKDLDLAFIRPKAKLSAPPPSLDLTNCAKADLLEQVIALNRLGGAANRAYAVSIERISAIVERPRLFYIPETSMTMTSVGSPAFTLDGKVLGIFVTRSIKNKGGGAGMLGIGSPAESMTGIIIPADDVLKALKQVPAPASQKESK